MTSWWLTLLDEQRRSGFADVSGTHATLRVPMSDRLLSRLLLQRLPPDWPIRNLDIEALADNCLNVRVRLTRPAFLPTLQVQLSIVRQPVLPSTPVLTLRFAGTGLSALAGPILGLFNALPRGVDRDGDLLHVDLYRIAESRGLTEYFHYLTSLEVATEPGRVVLTASGAVPPATP